MKEEGRRLEVHKPRRESQGHRPTLGYLPTFRYSKAMWLHFFPQQPLVSFQLAGPACSQPRPSSQWWQLSAASGACHPQPRPL